MSKESKDVNPPQAQRGLIVFESTDIRRMWHQETWWFSVVDVCGALTGSADAGAYWRKLKQRLVAETGQPVTFCHGLKLPAADGRQRETDCANTEGLLRVIQSVPSPKAEPFKRWLAQVGYERIQEIEAPELASARARALYEAKGYPKAWIEKRLRSVAIRGELTQEWQQRGVQEGREYAILTAEIARATFGVTPGEHSALKGLVAVKTGNNLRDHMTDLELIFTMLGEASTTEIARRQNAQGFPANQTSARAGGTIAGDARKALEEKTGQPVVSTNNHLALQTTPAAAVALTAFVETQTEAPVQKGQGKTTAHKKLGSKVAQTVTDLQRPAGKKK